MIRKRMRAWLAETHGPQFELVRHFLSDQLVNDLVSSGQAQRLVITVLSVVACVGPLVVRLYLPKYAYLQARDTGDLYLAAVRADRLFFISLSMITAGLLTVAQWQGLFPDCQDYFVLKPLPVRPYQLFLARFLSSFLVVAVVIADLNLVTSVLFPALTSGRWQSPAFGARYVLAHALATCGAGLFVFLALVALQGLLMNMLPPRAFDRFSVWIQALLAAALVAAVPYVLDLPNWHARIAARPGWISWLPPAWFLGLYEVLLGTQDSYLLRLRDRAGCGTGGTLILALAMYCISYRRQAGRILEQALPRTDWRSAIGGAASALLRIFMKSPQGLGVFVFTLHILRRSRHHKLVIAFWLAIAAVLALPAATPSLVTHLRSGGGWSAGQSESVLAVPLVLGAVLISALCYVFQLPSDAPASWVFRMAEGTARRELLDGVACLLVFCGLVPVLLFTAPMEVLAVGWGLALAHILLAAVLLLLLIEARLHDWHKIPFTCSYLPGRRNLWQTVGTYLLLFGALIPAITYCEARLLRPIALFGSAAVLSGVYFWLRSMRQGQWRAVPLLFDESDEPLITTVPLNRE